VSSPSRAPINYHRADGLRGFVDGVTGVGNFGRAVIVVPRGRMRVLGVAAGLAQVLAVGHVAVGRLRRRLVQRGGLAGRVHFGLRDGGGRRRGRAAFLEVFELRAREGVFMAFQYPIEVPGVSNAQFLRLAYNEKRKHLGEEELDPLEFKDLLKERAKVVEMEASFMSRSVNEGFSGGEKKRNEILQMAVLQPKLAILDETDSGLDIDALRVVAGGVNQLRTPDNAIIVVTHYQRLLNYIVPDYVHVLAHGRIAREGGKELAMELEEKGYDWLKQAAA